MNCFMVMSKVKSLGVQEATELESLLPDYVAHLEANPGSLLAKFCGVYSIERHSPVHDRHLGIGRRYLVMMNVLPPTRKMQRTFDLKGSSVGRSIDATDNGDSDYSGNGTDSVVMKDLDFVLGGYRLRLSGDSQRTLVHQLACDIGLLQRCGVMDYSFLVGIEREGGKYRPIGIMQFLPPAVQGCFRMIADSLQRRQWWRRPLWNRNIASTHGNTRYFLGVIDFLQPYTPRKWIESACRGLLHDRRGKWALARSVGRYGCWLARIFFSHSFHLFAR